jgi:hypothetical protein
LSAPRSGEKTTSSDGIVLTGTIPGASELTSFAGSLDVTDASNRDQYTISMPAVLYYEPGQAPAVVVLAQIAPGFLSGTFTPSGYLIDLTQ